MNKGLLTVLCAAGVLMGGADIYAQERDMPPPAGEEMLPPPPPRHSGKMRKAPKFDEKMHKRMAEKFAKDLGLTEEQQKKAEDLRKAGRKKMEPLFEEMKTLHEKMDKVREENLKEFETILTPEQKAKLEKMKAERKDFHKDRKGKHKKHDRKD